MLPVLVAAAQQAEHARRVGILMNRAAADPQGQAGVAAFKQTLQQSGWSDKDVRIDMRWGENDVDRVRKYAAELVGLAPDVILAAGALETAELQRLTRALPIVFVSVSDPVGAGVVSNLARPGGNATLNGHGAMSVSCPLLRETHPLAALADTVYEDKP
jgi:putative tryptophan/tyrosine transport system substrate-binding protein